MRLLITGGGGFIGTHMASTFHRAGAQVAILDLPKAEAGISPLESRVFNRREEMLSGVKKFDGDVRNGEILANVFKAFRPESLVNLASISLALGAEQDVDAAIALSTSSIHNIFLAARDYGTRSVVHFSSSYVYGDFQTEKCDESHPLAPINVYGRTKQVSEILCKTLSEVFGVATTIIRPIAVYGAGDLNGKFSSGNISSWIKDSRLALNGGKSRINTVTHLDDIIAGVAMALDNPDAAGETFNISSDEHLTNGDIQNEFKKLGYDLELVEPAQGILKVPVRGKVSIDKAAAYGFRPSQKFSDNLGKMIEFAVQ